MLIIVSVVVYLYQCRTEVLWNFDFSMWCENPPTIARCTYAIWSVGMCNKSDHADISQEYTAHVCLLSLICTVCIYAILDNFYSNQTQGSCQYTNAFWKFCQIIKYAPVYLHTYNLCDYICDTNVNPLFFVSKCKSVIRWVLLVHGFEKTPEMEMKYLQASCSMFTFPCAQVFEIHAPLALIRWLLLAAFCIIPISKPVAFELGLNCVQVSPKWVSCLKRVKGKLALSAMPCFLQPCQKGDNYCHRRVLSLDEFKPNSNNSKHELRINKLGFLCPRRLYFHE